VPWHIGPDDHERSGRRDLLPGLQEIDDPFLAAEASDENANRPIDRPSEFRAPPLAFAGRGWAKAFSVDRVGDVEHALGRDALVDRLALDPFRDARDAVGQPIQPAHRPRDDPPGGAEMTARQHAFGLRLDQDRPAREPADQNRAEPDAAVVDHGDDVVLAAPPPELCGEAREDQPFARGRSRLWRADARHADAGDRVLARQRAVGQRRDHGDLVPAPHEELGDPSGGGFGAAQHGMR
jgi:hypothetical protein